MERAQRFLLKAASRAYYQPPVRALVRSLVPLRTPEKWIFVVGCYNSGTKITKALLGAHPDVRTLPREGIRLTSGLPRSDVSGWTRMWSQVADRVRLPPGEDPDRARGIMKDWSPWWAPGGRAYLEKSVDNGARIEWLDRNFPNAYFVGIVRNGYCVAEGIQRKGRAKGEAAETLGSDRYPLEMCGRQWDVAARALADDLPRVARGKLVHFEDLVEGSGKVLSEIWEFLGLAPPLLREEPGFVEIAGERVSMLRDTNSGSLARLTPEEVAELNSVIAETMRRLGYEVL